MNLDPEAKRFYSHLAEDGDGAQFHIDLCSECHDALMSGAQLEATDAPPHAITETWERDYGHDCHVCGNETVSPEYDEGIYS